MTLLCQCALSIPRCLPNTHTGHLMIIPWAGLFSDAVHSSGQTVQCRKRYLRSRSHSYALKMCAILQRNLMYNNRDDGRRAL